MRFAQQYAFLIDKMIVADMGIKTYPSHHEHVFQGLFAVDVAHCAGRKEAEERLSKFVAEQSTLQFLLKNLYWKEPGVLAWRFNLETLFREREHLMAAIPEERFDSQTLFLTGGKSQYVPDADRESIRKVAVHAQFQTMVNAGHWLHAEDPEAFINHCLDYFNA